ncbi:MAG: hypothetical protein AB7I19_16830, partial [Planctomycetota bacterium]
LGCLLAIFLSQSALRASAAGEPISAFDVVLIWAEADSCGCDAKLEKVVDATLKFCGVSQACLEIEILADTATDGKCWLPDTNCPWAVNDCEFVLRVRVKVHSTCCCAAGSNGANVHVTGHGCDFVALGVANAEEFTISSSRPCIEDPVESLTVHVSVSCNKSCSEIDENGEYPNSDVSVVRRYECAACEKK